MLLFSTAGCVSTDGGAVEASWVVFTHDGRGVSDCACTCPRIAKIRLALASASDGTDPCAGNGACTFSCNSMTGATRFDIPPGTYAISLVPVGEDGNDIAPAAGGGTCNATSPVGPVVREITKGHVTELPAIEVDADCAAECGGFDSEKVCTR